ncbi:MAG: translation elongation factor-like protein [Patescibacteria group bacterium]
MAKEKEIGKVSHWYDKINVAVIKLTGSLKKGDRVKFKHGEEEFEENVGSLQIDHVEVEEGKKGDELAVKLSHKAKEGSIVCEVE